MTNWMREPLHKHYAQSLSVDNLLYDSETDHQRIKVFENGTFGRILTLDDQSRLQSHHLNHLRAIDRGLRLRRRNRCPRDPRAEYRWCLLLLG